jgi:hypothetical protein
MKVGKKIVFIGMLLLLGSFIIPQTTFAAKPNNVIIQFETQMIDFLYFDWYVDGYGANHYDMVVLSEITTEDCPLQGFITMDLDSRVYPSPVFGFVGLGIWTNTFEGTYNGKKASWEGWTTTWLGAGHGYYFGKGALAGYIVKYTIEMVNGVLLETVELVQRDMKKNINFEYVYDVIGSPADIWPDSNGVWYLFDTPHWGHVTDSDKHYFYGDIYYENVLILLDDLMNPTTFNGMGYGLFEFDGIYKGREASFTGNLGFIIDNFAVIGHFLAVGEGALAGCLITGYLTAVVGGSSYVEMSIYRLH